MGAIGTLQTKSAKIRKGLDHPVIDCDGHLREFLPIYEDYLKRVAGPDFARKKTAELTAGIKRMKRMDPTERQRRQAQQWAWWGATSTDVVDYATQVGPQLVYKRLDDFGVDFCLLYPSLGLVLNTNPDKEVRTATMRAMNEMHAELYNRDFADRLNVPAVIPMHTPEEAIAALEHAVVGHGFKVIQIPPGVLRPIKALAEKYPGIENEAPDGVWVDRFGMDSEHDYDPFWQRCVDLKVAVTSHGALMPTFPKINRSISNYTFNHVRNQPTMMEQLCKTLYMGGVTRRFPTLNFAFMEGGVSWACNLLSDIVGHWEKRNLVALERLNPANLDQAAAYKLIVQYAGPRYDMKSPQATIDGVFNVHGDEPENRDDFAAMKIGKKEDMGELFSRFYFGCEADDRMNAWAFDTRLNRFNMKLKPLLSSDISHFDVVHMDQVLEEAYEGVEHGVISPEDFRDMMATNPIRLHGGMNPDFFKGTVVESYAEKVLSA